MQIKTKKNWLYHLHPATESPPQFLLLLHGWTGSENSMRIFLGDLLPNYEIILPRGPYLADSDKGGYSWRKIIPGTWGLPTLQELQPAADSLVSLLSELAAEQGASPRFNIAGFSQGGALTTVITALHPDKVQKAAILSAFIPSGVAPLLQPRHLAGMRIYWSHGSQDKLIPLERGKEAAALLEAAGAKVEFCSANFDHRVGSVCRHALKKFLND